ncbi:MAG: hypothetical protein IRY99_23690 [Isosphaeraceae bacterium]|nr:hypothetical protein [Isosphaeraceae bacterium]
MRFALHPTTVLALVVVTLATMDVQAQDALTYIYRDEDGEGRLTVRDVGPAEGVEGGHQIQVLLEQNGRRYEGTGIRYVLNPRMPVPTLLTFAITTPARAYFFQGVTTSGVTVAGKGTYHPVGAPRRRYEWSLVLGAR